jgi:hypothetical protein
MTRAGQQLFQGQSYSPGHGSGTESSSVETPLRVSHEIVFEVYFSVANEDARGRALPVPGPGGLRFLRVQKPIIVPSVSEANLTI